MLSAKTLKLTKLHFVNFRKFGVNYVCAKTKYYEPDTAVDKSYFKKMLIILYSCKQKYIARFLHNKNFF